MAERGPIAIRQGSRTAEGIGEVIVNICVLFGKIVRNLAGNHPAIFFCLSYIAIWQYIKIIDAPNLFGHGTRQGDHPVYLIRPELKEE